MSNLTELTTRLNTVNEDDTKTVAKLLADLQYEYKVSGGVMAQMEISDMTVIVANVFWNRADGEQYGYMFA